MHSQLHGHGCTEQHMNVERCVALASDMGNVGQPRKQLRRVREVLKFCSKVCAAGILKPVVSLRLCMLLSS